MLVKFTYKGDTNLDGQVDEADLDALAANWALSEQLWSEGDSNYDGMVDVTDLGALATNWYASPAAIATPEPFSALLLAVGSVALLRRRR